MGLFTASFLKEVNALEVLFLSSAVYSSHLEHCRCYFCALLGTSGTPAHTIMHFYLFGVIWLQQDLKWSSCFEFDHQWYKRELWLQLGLNRTRWLVNTEGKARRLFWWYFFFFSGLHSKTPANLKLKGHAIKL